MGIYIPVRVFISCTNICGTTAEYVELFQEQKKKTDIEPGTKLHLPYKKLNWILLTST